MTEKPTYEELAQRVKELEKEVVEREQTEDMLRESEELYRAIFEQAADSIVLVDGETGALVEFNERAYENLGFTSEEFEKLKIPDFEVIESTEEVANHIKKIIEDGADAFETKDRTKGGAIRDIHVGSKNISIHGRDIVQIIWRDITERTQAEQSLRESEERHRTLIETSPDVIFGISTGDGTIISLNPAFEKITGWSDEEWIGQPFTSIMHPDDIPLATEKFQEVLSGQITSTFELRIPSKSREELVGEFLAAPEIKSGKVTGIFGFARDITERKQTEKALLESKERFRRLSEVSFEGIFIHDRGKVVDMNKTLETILGYEHSEIIGKNLMDFVAQEYRDIVMKNFSSDCELPYEAACCKKDGSILPIEVCGKNTTYAGYKFRVVAIRDITKQKKTEEALREREERFRSLAENAPDIIFTLDREGVWTYVNPAFEEILGYSRDEVIGKYAIGIINEKHVRNHIGLFKRIRDEKETIKNESIPLTHKDGSERLFNTSASCNVDLQGNMTGVVGLLKDITEHHSLEAQFRQSQKMEAIGTLAGGIAHDFNNILMGIQGRTSLMLIDADSSHPHFEHLIGIEDYVKNAVDLTKQLLGFARSGKYEVKPTDLNEVIKGQNRMFGRTKKEISIRGKYEETLWTVEADQGQIGQVLLNLYVNAWQAMPDGGSLYVQTENVMLNENSVKPFDLKPGKYVKISVTDTGVGMDKEIQQRIFDPFFTTKEMGRGTGLGLASVYGIIKNHGGIINVYSEKGVGSTFNIYLPASEKEPIKDMRVQEHFLKGKETILLVDDEDMIIDVGTQLLVKLGYNVFLAKGGREAVKVYKNNKDTIDLVILDMIMPDMGGAETYDRMKEINPDLRVLLSSGYAENALAMEILERGCDGFIQKPFNMKQLSQKIREILESIHP